MKNSYEIRGDTCVILINSQRYGQQEAIISLNKLERALEFPNTWCVTRDDRGRTFYVFGRMPAVEGKRRLMYLHRWITNATEGMEVDHHNHNGLDNTDDNISVVTKLQNMQNRRKQKNNTSGIRGVTWSKQMNKWLAQMQVKGKYVHLGFHDDIKDAGKAVSEARKIHMPFSKEA